MVRNREFIYGTLICFGLRAHVDALMRVLVRERFIYKVGYSFNKLFIWCRSDHYSQI